MSIPYDEIVSSPIVKFLVGKKQTPKNIHKALVAAQSLPLRNLVSGLMEEARTRTVIWADVGEDTFAMFAQFLYCADYTPPSCYLESRRGSVGDTASDVEIPAEAIADVPKEEAREVPLYPDGEPSLVGFDRGIWNSWGKTTNKDKKKGVSGRFASSKEDTSSVHGSITNRTNFHELVHLLHSASIGVEPHPNKSAAEDYTAVLLGHARLYVLAEKYDVKSLKALILHKLHRTLCTFTLYEARYGDIVELAKYTYENTPSRPQMDALRELVTHYISYEAKQVTKSTQCLTLVAENGSFAKDLLAMVLEQFS